MAKQGSTSVDVAIGLTIVLVPVVAFMAVPLYFVHWLFSSGPEAKRSEDLIKSANRALAACDLRETEIKLAGGRAVEDRLKWQLKAPSTATFSGWESSYSVARDCTIEMTGWVDAQNSFGAMIRTPWVAHLHGSGINLEVSDAHLLD